MSTINSSPARGKKARKDNIVPAGIENLSRLKSNLKRNEAALSYLYKLGLAKATIDKFHLGIKEPYQGRADGAPVSNLLCYPMLSRDGLPLNRYGYVNIPGVTENAPRQDNWSPGRPVTYLSASPAGGRSLFVVDTCQELWLLDQHLGGSPLGNEIAFVASSCYGSIPAEWRQVEFWAPWAKVYFGHRSDGPGEQRSRDLSRLSGREVFRVRVSEEMGNDWLAFFNSGGTVEQYFSLLQAAPVVSGIVQSKTDQPDLLGEFAVAPVNINGAFVHGHLYYPFTVERRELETLGRRSQVPVSRVVTSYVTKVLRSDGTVLDVVRLDAPRGTSRERHVLALTDGTRIEKEPQPTHYATWHLASLQAFIRAMQSGRPAPHRPLNEILDDVSLHLRSSVWLPHEEDYGLLTLYVALTFVYQVFDAIPLIFVLGEKGTGKSELGDAMASISCNATVIGQGSAAGVIRLLNEARGLIVLDDLESIGRALKGGPFCDIGQMLKLSYKKRTGRKAIADRDGRTTVFDFYGPKVINNTSGVDPILGSRLFLIRTHRIPDKMSVRVALHGGEPDDGARLRNELHVWGMSNARLVHEVYTGLAKEGRDRRDEITTPLRVIAKLAGDTTLLDHLELVLKRQESGERIVTNPVEMLREAIDNCIRRGATQSIAAAQIYLELALLGRQFTLPESSHFPPVWRRPEWVGNQLTALRIRRDGVRVMRIRLYGMITRVYGLSEEYVHRALSESCAGGSLPVQLEPLDFCEQTACSSCIYDSVCASVLPGLKDSKAGGRRRSGRNNSSRSH